MPKKPENVQSSTGFDPVLPSAIVKRASKPHVVIEANFCHLPDTR